MDPSSGYPLQTSLNDLTPPRVVAVNTVNLCISLNLLGIAIRHWMRQSSRFNIAQFGPVTALLMGDAAYFLAISHIITPNANEPFRTIGPVVATWLSCGLACIRFQVFAEAGLAPWYSKRISTMIIAAIYTHGIISVCILVASYVQQLHLPAFQTHPWRKMTSLVQFGVNALADLILAVCTFKIVWGMRQAVLKRQAASGNMLGSSAEQGAQMMTMTLPPALMVAAPDSSSQMDDAYANESTTSGDVLNKSSRQPATNSSTHHNGSLSPHQSGTEALGSSLLTVPPKPSLNHSPSSGGIGGGLRNTRSIPSMRSIASNALAPLHFRSRSSASHPAAHTVFLAKSAQMLMLIAFMISISIGGIIIFLFSKDKFTDAVGLVALKVYLGATMLQWGLVLELLK